MRSVNDETHSGWRGFSELQYWLGTCDEAYEECVQWKGRLVPKACAQSLCADGRC